MTGSRIGKQEDALRQMVSTRSEARAEYQAAKRTRFNQRRKGVSHSGSSADYHFRSDYEYYDLIESAYDLERNDSVVGQLINLRTSNVVQGGFRYEPNTGDKHLDVDVKARVEDWAQDPEQCDVSGESCFHDFEIAADWTMTLAGDCGIALTYEGPLQFFEPYLIRNDYSRDGIVLGVELDDERRRLAYWIAEDAIDPYDVSFTNFSPIETRDPEGHRQFFHVYNRKRMTQSRGVTALAPVFELTGMLEDVAFAKLVQQQIVSCIAFLVEETVEGSKLPSTGKDGTGIGAPAENPPRLYGQGNNAPLFSELIPGAEVNPGPGKKVTGFSPQIPNSEYFQQHRQILQMICGNLELPLAVGMLDGSETNFHGFIGAINEAKKLWERSQERLVKQFHRPCIRGKIRHFIAEDRFFRAAAQRSDVDIFGGEWRTPKWQSVQPDKDTSDRLTRLNNAISSPSVIQSELGRDYETHVNQTVSDNAYAITQAKRKAIEINSDPDLQDGQPVHWNQLYPTPVPTGIKSTADLVNAELKREEQTEERVVVAA